VSNGTNFRDELSIDVHFDRYELRNASSAGDTYVDHPSFDTVLTGRLLESQGFRVGIIAGIEVSLRRIATYGDWSDKVRGSVLPDSKADLPIYGNAEWAVVEVAHRLAVGEKIAPEHTEEGRGQYLIPYFISAHPGTRDEDMINPAQWRILLS
jgi:radical SAM superfamily enzyme YgiQ (UPF0313 family)